MSLQKTNSQSFSATLEMPRRQDPMVIPIRNVPTEKDYRSQGNEVYRDGSSTRPAPDEIAAMAAAILQCFKWNGETRQSESSTHPAMCIEVRT